MSELLFKTSESDCRINRLAELVEIVQQLRGRHYFRGMRDACWDVVPSIAHVHRRYFAGRNVPQLPDDQEKERERQLLHRFRRRTYEHQGRVLSPWEALILARHYGLPVRLMDWTMNPLVGLFFACEHQQQAGADGAIWGFEPGSAPELDVFADHEPTAIKGVRILFPFYPTPRMTAQSALFTIHQHPWIDIRLLTADTYEPQHCDISKGYRWIVPREKKSSLLGELNRMGINRRTLYPELEGLARGLVEEEVFRELFHYEQTNSGGE